MLNRLLNFIKQKADKRRENLENEIKDTYDELIHVGMHGKATWDMYSNLHQQYHHLQARYLSKYGTYYRNGNIGSEFGKK